MRVTSFGCSLTFGTDLSDCHDKIARRSFFSELTWPSLIAKILGANYLCRAQGGSGNLCIADRVLEYCTWPNEILIINWTFIDRFDYSDPQGAHFCNGLNDYLTLNPGESGPLHEHYFRNLQSEYRDKFTNLMLIKSVIDILLQNNCQFIMTALDDLLWCDQYNAPRHIKDLQKHIKPYICNFHGTNFLDWSRSKNYRISESGHPLEEAHKAAADVMMPAIDTILHRA